MGQKQSVLEKRYFRGTETTEFDLFKRVSDFLGNNDLERNSFYQEMATHRFLPNTPCLVNAGVPGSSGQLFACLSGDTIIHTLKGEFTIRDLCDMYKSDERFEVYSCDGNEIRVGRAFNPRITRKNAAVYEVTLRLGKTYMSNGRISIENNQYGRSGRYDTNVVKNGIVKIKLTEDHLVMMRDGSYLRVDELHIGDSIMPFNHRYSEQDLLIYKYIDSQCVRSQDLVFEDVYGELIGVDELIHHKNCEHNDNTSTNLQKLTKSEHMCHHQMSNNSMWGDTARRKHSNRMRGNQISLGIPWTDERKNRMSQNNGMRRNEVQLKGAITSYFKRLTSILTAGLDLTEEHFVSSYRYMTDGKYAIKHLNERWGMSFQDLVDQYDSVRLSNHEIISVEPAGCEDVYDLSVEVYHNFAANGVFVHNCFVLPVEDSMTGIFTTLLHTALIHKTGGGTGFNFSKIRPKNSNVKSTNGIASGPISFMHAYDASTETVKQGGVRRGANMACFSIHHPDVMDFIMCKDDLKSFQNFNISIALDSEFMNAVENDLDWEFSFDGKKWGIGTSARHLMDMIVTQAWKNGEPGILFLDRINDTHPLPDIIESVNPCLTGDTLVFTGDGRYVVPIEQLYEEFKANPHEFNVPVLTWDDKLQRNKFQKINWVLDSGIKDVYRVTLDDGSYVDATAEHKFLLSDGSTIQLKNMHPGMSLMPFHANNSKADLYVNLNDGSNVNYYHLQAEYMFDTDISLFGRTKNDLNVHHRDEEHTNNFLYNIEVKNTSLHSSDHISGNGNPMRHWYHGTATLEEKQKYHDTMSAATSGERNSQYGKPRSDSTKVLIGAQTKRYMQDQDVIIKHRAGNNRHRASMIKQVVEMLQANNLEFTEANYNQYKLYVSKVCPSWDTILRTAVGFGISNHREFFDYLLTSFNHRIVSIEHLGSQQVYDMNVNDNHNFAIVTKHNLRNNGSYNNLVDIENLDGIILCNCGEQPLLPYESCCLGSMNLSKFVNNRKFDVDLFENAVNIGIQCLNKMLDRNVYPIPEIEKASTCNRKIGLGVMGYADMLIKMGLRFGSSEALEFTDYVASNYQSFAHAESIRLGKRDGVFTNFDKSSFQDPHRNATVTTIAPTGTISTIAECSSGIEPIFSDMMIVRRVDSIFTEIHPLYEELLKERGLYDKFIKHAEDSQRTRLPSDPEIKKPDIREYLSDLADVIVSAHEVTPEQHIRTQAIWQKYTDNAVSKTINMPKESTKEDVHNAYMLAYELGCKGLTVYRDGSRDNQVLSTVSAAEELKLERGVIEPINDNAIGRKRSIRTGCGKLHMQAWFDPITGELKEVFFNKGSEGGCNSHMSALSRTASLAARAGANITQIVEQLESSLECASYVARRAKYGDTAPGTSCPSAAGKLLVKLQQEVKLQLGLNSDIKVTTITNPIDGCVQCGAPVRHESGCTICTECGFSTCG